MSDQSKPSEGKRSDAPGHSEGARPPGARTLRKDPLPSIDDLVRQMMLLNGRVLLGQISVQVASFLQKNLKTVLDAQLKRTTSGESTPAAESLFDACRRDPSLISVLEPFLSEEQLQSLMAEITHDPPESV